MINQESLRNALNVLGHEIHTIAVDHGWWDIPEWLKELTGTTEWNYLLPSLRDAISKAGERNDGENIALMHSELSEGLEGIRHHNPPSDHIPEFSAAEEEMADVIIRVLDLSHKRGWDIAGALIAKIEFNRARPYKHGGKKF